MRVYVKKDGSGVQEFPVPTGKEDWIEVEVASAEEYSGKEFDFKSNSFVVPASVIEHQVRDKRNALLTEADILVNKALDLGDPIFEKEARSYRQDLRDVPDQEGFPDNIDWPTKPA